MGNLFANLHFSLNAHVLWIIWFVALLGFIISALVYTYHWKNYGTDERFMRQVETVYISVGTGLLLLSALLIHFK